MTDMVNGDRVYRITRPEYDRDLDVVAVCG